MDTDALIDAVLARPALWQGAHPQHTKRLWEEVALLFPDIGVDELKKKWKNLKDAYRKELKKAPKGVAAYASSWRHFSRLHFIRGQVAPAAAEGDERDDSADPGSSEDEKPALEFLTFTETEVAPAPVPAAVPEPSARAKRRVAADPREEYLEIERKKLRLLEAEVARREGRDGQPHSGDYHFLMSLLPEMQRLPAARRLRLRQTIVQALLEATDATCSASSPSSGSAP